MFGAGACHKRHQNGDVDGCRLFEPSSNPKYCDGCGCHRSDIEMMWMSGSIVAGPVLWPYISMGAKRIRAPMFRLGLFTR